MFFRKKARSKKETPYTDVSVSDLEKVFINRMIQELSNIKFTYETTSKKSDEEINREIEEINRRNQNSTNPKHHRSSEETDLYLDFSTKYHEEIIKYESDIYGSRNSALHSAAHVDEVISKCRSAVNIFYTFKDFCDQKGKGGQIYFENMWLYCENARNPCFSYIEDVEEKLKKIEANYSHFKEYFNTLTNLSNILLSLIPKNGILQKDIYTLIPIIEPAVIRSHILALEKDKSIKRVKLKSTYILFAI